MQKKYSNLIKFILLTFIISWGSWGTIIFLNKDLLILRVLGCYGPFISLLFILFKRENKELKERIFKSLRTWNVHFGWYIFAILGTAIIGILAIIINNLLFDPVTFTKTSLSFVLIAIPYVLLTSVIGEETGWRGYALNFLNKEFRPLQGSLVTGILWGLWHLPLFYISSDFHKFIPFPLFLIQSIFMTYIYTWIYTKTKSLLIQHLFHTFSNITLGLLPLLPSTQETSVRPLVITIILLSLLTSILVIKEKDSFNN